MSVLTFSKEFTDLVNRWQRPISLKDEPLTNAQILNDIQDVIQMMMGQDLRIINYSSLKTPSSEIAVCTPTAPMVSKINHEDSNASLTRFSLLDTLSFSFDSNISTPTPELSISQMRIARSKLISRSSPSIYISSINGTDTLNEQPERDEANGIANERPSNTTPKNKPIIHDLKNVIHDMLELCKHAANVVMQIDNSNKEEYPQTMKPIRRLSSVGVGPNLSRSTALMRQIPPPKFRRSTTGIPGTPTSSKLKMTSATNRNGISKRKSTTGNSLTVRSSKVSSTEPSSTTASTSEKKSPLDNNTVSKTRKATRVQSTSNIGAGKKKT
ncbi:uncharacterized protein LOC122401025 isoform X2 [Colletes gigas]|uniref:uncharacterized protein LOC122401025 isoform X2 n=1 Tax=Colletes gigas TaxID=935657 RepID=UPI001C9BAE4B|nr:uncharacterized protein LOC122401025 isoform X2 [Colletes gigas]